MNFRIMQPLRVFFLSILYSCFISTLPVLSQYPSDSASISLLTASPGNETYAAFGHSAIHVHDPLQRIDYVYNYGTFDFSNPNFYLKFGFGRLMYFLSISGHSRFLSSYQGWGQAIWSQKLNLTNKEKWQLVQNLDINYQEANRYYRYGFFRDNCATRIRDIIEKSVDGKIIYDSAYITKKESFRQLFSAYLAHDPWIIFGIDLLMGKGTDSIAGIKDYMFLPNHLMNIYASAKISSNNSIRALSDKPVELFPSRLSFPKPNPLASPVPVFWLLFAIVAGITYLGYKKRRYTKWFDVLLFSLSGFLGLLLFSLMAGSLHHELWYNLNIVWANPVNLAFAAGLFIKRRPNWLTYLFIGYGALLVIFIPASFLFVQVIPGAAYPLMALLLIRIGRILYS